MSDLAINLSALDPRIKVIAQSERLRLLENKFIVQLPFFRPVRVKILIVTDGSGSFDGTASFGLGRVINELQSDPWWWVRFEVVTAHRRAAGDPFANTATHKSFRFDTPPVSLNDFDQIWLFGVEPTGQFPLGGPEVTALTNFMNSGRGVFATGDHESLGDSLCGDLPRINKMRRWRTGGVAGDPPPAGGGNQHDTRRNDPQSGYNQSDDTPQRIQVTRYYDPWNFSAFKQRWRPHPVLCGRHGVIDVLPDHQHEGWIVTPTAATIAANPAEWPGGIAPEIIAEATVLAGSGANPKSFGVLGAYNGHQANPAVGRIVVDATWHHWFNINLMGFDPASADYDNIRNYFWNVALWLAPPDKQTAMFNKAIQGLPWVTEIQEFSVKTDLALFGFSGVDAIGRRASQCVLTEWIIDLLPLKLREPLRHRPIPPIPPIPPDPPWRALLEDIREFIVGGALREVFRNFGPGTVLAQAPSDKQVADVVRKGALSGLTELLQRERRGLEEGKKALDLLSSALQ